MLIDWFTVGAQALNFIILVWLLKHFLYKPVLAAIDTREKRIAAEVADANTKRAEAQKSRDDFQAKDKAFDDQRATLLAKAVDDAKADHDRLVGDARKEADALRASQQASLRDELSALGAQVRRSASDEVFAIARKTLADLATVSLEERMGEVFTRRLRQMDAQSKEALGAALRGSAEPAVVTSTFDIPGAQRAAIQNALNETFSTEVKVRFADSDTTVCGIELRAGGQKVGWSIAEYLGALDRRVGGLLDSQGPGAKPGAAVAATHVNAAAV